MPTKNFVPKEFNLSSMSEGHSKKILDVLTQKGIPNTWDDSIDRSDSDSYSQGMSVALDACKKGCNIFELRSGSDDVYFWLVKSDKDLVEKFTKPEKFIKGKSVNYNDWEDDDGISEEEEENDD